MKNIVQNRRPDSTTTTHTPSRLAKEVHTNKIRLIKSALLSDCGNGINVKKRHDTYYDIN